MSAIAQFLSIIVKWGALISLMVMGLLIYKRQNNKRSMMFLSGITVLAVGQVIQEFSPAAKLIFDGAGNPVSISDTSIIWYAGSILSSIGIIISILGFGWVTLTNES